MDRQPNSILRVGDWRVNPPAGEISRNGETAKLDARAMRLLVYLAQRPGEVVSIDELLDQVWSGVIVSQDSVYQAVTSLRRVLGDDPKQPTYIATVPRLGYRMLAPVKPWTDGPPGFVASGTLSPVSPAPSVSSVVTETGKVRALAPKSAVVWLIGAGVCVGLFIAFFHYSRAGSSNHAAEASVVIRPEKSVAVLAFLDLTEKMREEEFADGLSEEIIDKVSKLPGFRVPAATASFYFKYKQVPVADIAKALGVVYVLDGSTRQSGNSIRIAARLVRAENGYVIWSETYDRPFANRTALQDEVASKVANALGASINAATTASPSNSR
jgi:transcriptional activator of cad operon